MLNNLSTIKKEVARQILLESKFVSYVFQIHLKPNTLIMKNYHYLYVGTFQKLVIE